jgi:hypothetical protein
MAIFMTMSLTVLFSVLGLSVDLGYSYFVKLEAQTAADSAATAAAIYAVKNGFACGTNVTCNSTYSCPTNLTSAANALEAGCLYAQSNGFLNTGSQAVSLIANNTSVGGAVPALWIQANTSQTLAHWFLFLSGSGSGPVAAQSLAGVNITANPSCIYVLSLTALNALNVTGGSSLTTSGCGIYVNSNNSTAAINVGGSAAVTATGQAIDVIGKVVKGAAAVITPAATTVTKAAADPLAGLVAPTVSTTCYQTNYSLGNSKTDTIDPGPNGQPYCGGITVSGTAVLTMHPGTYIMNGGGFNITHGGTVTSTGGVTIFLTGQNGFTAAGMQLVGDSITNLSAPSSGPYQGVLFYQDPGVSYVSANSFANSATLNATGTFYFKTTALSFSGNVAGSKIGLVVSTLSIGGSSTFNQDTTGTYTGLATKASNLIQ